MTSRIYIVEDSTRFRDILAECIVSSGGFEVCGSSGSAEEAFKELPDARADLIVIDISLPGMSGLDLLRQLRKQLPQTPCVIVSGHSTTSQYAQQARDAGADDYLEKTRGYDLPIVMQRVLEARAPSKRKTKRKPSA